MGDRTRYDITFYEASALESYTYEYFEPVYFGQFSSVVDDENVQARLSQEMKKFVDERSSGFLAIDDQGRSANDQKFNYNRKSIQEFSKTIPKYMICIHILGDDVYTPQALWFWKGMEQSIWLIPDGKKWEERVYDD